MDDYTGGEEPAHGSRRSDVPHSHHQRYQSTDSARHLRENRAYPSLSEFTQNNTLWRELSTLEEILDVIIYWESYGRSLLRFS